MSLENLVVSIAAYIIPMYVANSSALVFGGGLPLDFNKKLFNRPIFGKGKTIRGTFAGLFFGILAASITNFFIPKEFVGDYLLFGVLLVLGAIIGDLAGSFIKRRFGIARGQPVLLLDQLDFVLGGFAFTFWMRVPSIVEVAIIIILTLFVHKASNYIAYKLKMKKVPW
ncbi:MAG: CDP-2,3-bis-(O-geranylgeranyl)-sn-glycerol synthase [Candidatus Diapherotrites archaeon]|nr:CDP-2,3-bis-(O-geranylgeranyl)-sn-glycerol synthase [Candidatus Diapherotrites archaeon]